ncbi:short transient receptor potential channel 3-like [Amphiura filiformis]|uniref:short transient receptor potential channel 3-like n=1 Tax=Amphiura filiformis TaxID=82378 RepID=UPI003B21C06E
MLSNQAVVIEKAGMLLYAGFYVLMIVVLLNALIAVMSEAYNTVEENADMEWKFHSTVMWMSILLDDDVIPPPFNLLPSIESIKKFINKCRRWRKICRRGVEDSNSDDGKAENENLFKQADDKSQYKRVINKLVERYVMDKTKDGVSVNAEVNITDILGLKNDLQTLKLELFQRLIETNHRINKTTVDGHAIRDTSTKAKTLLNKTEEINENVDAVLNKTVFDFKTSVLTHKDNILKEVEEFEMNAPSMAKDEGLLNSSLFRNIQKKRQKKKSLKKKQTKQK